jgi:hypothetical protein
MNHRGATGEVTERGPKDVRPVVAPRAKRGCKPPIKQRSLNIAKWGEAVRHQTDASVRSSSISSTTTGACYFNDETPGQAAARCLMRHSNCEREGYIRGGATPHHGSLWRQWGTESRKRKAQGEGFIFPLLLDRGGRARVLASGSGTKPTSATGCGEQT